MVLLLTFSFGLRKQVHLYIYYLTFQLWLADFHMIIWGLAISVMASKLFHFLLLITDFLNGAFDHRLGRLQDSNAVLSHFNEYSENCYAEVSVDLAKNTRVLKSMKADLDYIFQKLRYASASSLVSLLTSYLFVPFKLLE